MIDEPDEIWQPVFDEYAQMFAGVGVWSQLDRVRDCRRCDVWLEYPCRDDVDRAAEQFFQLDVQGGEIEQVGSRLEVHEQIDVAVFVVLRKCDAQGRRRASVRRTAAARSGPLMARARTTGSAGPRRARISATRSE